MSAPTAGAARPGTARSATWPPTAWTTASPTPTSARPRARGSRTPPAWSASSDRSSATSTARHRGRGVELDLGEMPDPPLLTVPQVAAELQVTSQTIRNWIDHGTLPAVRIGRGFRVRRADVDELLRRASADSTSLATRRDVWQRTTTTLPPAATRTPHAHGGTRGQRHEQHGQERLGRPATCSCWREQSAAAILGLDGVGQSRRCVTETLVRCGDGEQRCRRARPLELADRGVERQPQVRRAAAPDSGRSSHGWLLWPARCGGHS